MGLIEQLFIRRRALAFPDKNPVFVEVLKLPKRFVIRAAHESGSTKKLKTTLFLLDAKAASRKGVTAERTGCSCEFTINSVGWRC
jgi:hypothetical protein